MIRKGDQRNATLRFRSIAVFLTIITSWFAGFCNGNPTVLKHLEDGEVGEAHRLLSETFRVSERNPDPKLIQSPLSQRKIRRGGGFFYTSEYKLRADLEQARHLVERLSEPGWDPETAMHFAETVVPIYERVLARIPPVNELEDTHGLYRFSEEDIADGILDVYNKALYIPDEDEFGEDGSRIPILGDSLDTAAIEKEWSQNGIVIIDDLLSAEALARIRRVMEDSTVWYQTKLPKKFGGYTGAYIDDGLHQRILLALSVELRERLPGILKEHPLKYLWAYKYDSELEKGINLHADEAAVNVNIWLTPKEGNLDPSNGGLVVFTVKPPEDWDLNQYNRDTDAVYKDLLEPAGFANVTIPYRENRAVLFDSALFHQTDSFRFRPGYRNRRINLTILYGEMQKRKSNADGREEL